ncbi:MAG: hypothetical protein A3C84_00345 [Candidatus Ryanbacteria bacterium RIFCSPHIGHO2_02_FULL_48_12]|uniref:CYTH domain-containing protein n=1 Tax=Candidatus Ryanbacteria bacterium RIFCSPHIGHO2_01_FULL_48_27 TaxID=1802115 RepID=A0A1G2G6Q0_9BACT|nr:MAG: hypothetical protein A2756_02480 [Candidatus Ryanbacteria bacterium RIFCSPHIGHO2_01_FULL_48_27]OGZ50464.1 MAG: hypothetical protein A3C84_00345 [Candidatus Ryanbacteria bacterium RIFCSPHIGHO2_02_FULL_48_12]
MLEVEKKFELDDASQAKLLAGTSFVSEKTFTDTYFDTKDFSLTTKDIWLRDRGGRFELKVPLNDTWDKRVSDQYRELETDAEISEFLHLADDTALKEALHASRYMPFASIVTTRRKYRKDKFIIDIDVLDFGYQIAEIELMVKQESDIPVAVAEIIAFASAYGLRLGYVRGKVIEYIRRNNLEHLRALVAAGVAPKTAL